MGVGLAKHASNDWYEGQLLALGRLWVNLNDWHEECKTFMFWAIMNIFILMQQSWFNSKVSPKQTLIDEYRNTFLNFQYVYHFIISSKLNIIHNIPSIFSNNIQKYGINYENLIKEIKCPYTTWSIPIFSLNCCQSPKRKEGVDWNSIQQWSGIQTISHIHQTHAGESKRPIAERTPNSWETERPIDNILIEMAQEAGRYPCLELNN